MSNVFHTPVAIHRRFDLKGSTVGRQLKEEHKSDPSIAWKDNDLRNSKEKISLGKDRREFLLQQIRTDTAWLSAHDIIDYSLLLGIHYGKQGGELEGLLDSCRSPSDQDLDSLINSSPSSSSSSSSSSSFSSPLSFPPEEAPGGAEADDLANSSFRSIFQKDFGGMLSENKENLYFLGIIDVSSRWTAFKKAENAIKTIQARDNRGISCVPPAYYAERFHDFIKSHLE
eukprot:GHVT01089508.1.p1 GENE.GHVT01089508.1~~GHVT01089508.1.p1  ORF type:complete len:228 (+),score=60.86 GHVT01089508.1:496-1179(+)